MTTGVGAALMEELAVDKRTGIFVNHDLAGYEVPNAVSNATGIRVRDEPITLDKLLDRMPEA